MARISGTISHALPNCVGELPAQATRRFGDKTALVFGDQRWSFRQLDEVSSKVAAHLGRRHVGAGAAVSGMPRTARRLQVPRAFQILDELPRTSTGKILRRKLRNL